MNSKYEEPYAADGRNINTGSAALSGEASTQIARRHDARDSAIAAEAYSHVPSHQSQTSPSYYDHPMLKEPAWIWSIPTYFFVGGASGIAATFGAAAQLFAPSAMRALIVRSHWIGTVGGALSAALLIHDLGRPERFLNMLRVFRVRSPMSMGSWILVVFSTSAGLAAVLPLGPRLFRFLIAPFGLVAGLFGLGLAGYTGVLISQTAVPLWQAGYRINPVLFLASASAAAASLFDFFPLNPLEHRAVERFGLAGKAVEITAAYLLEREVGSVPRAARPFHEGFTGALWRTAKVLTLVSAVISILPGRSRKKRFAFGILGSAASLCLRFAVFYAGKKSSRDPRASFEQQRRIPPPRVSPE